MQQKLSFVKKIKKLLFPTRSLKDRFFKIGCMNEFYEKLISPAKAYSQMHVDLLAEQARIVARLAEITAILNGGNPLAVKIKSVPTQTRPKDFDRKAYAIGLIWRNPAISARELTRKAGIARSTLDMPGWSDVVNILKASKKASSNDYKDYTEQVDDDEDETL